MIRNYKTSDGKTFKYLKDVKKHADKKDLIVYEAKIWISFKGDGKRKERVEWDIKYEQV